MRHGFSNASLILFILCLCVGCAAVQPVAKSADSLHDNPIQLSIRKTLQHGDWLVARGLGGGDNFVSSVTNMALSHAAIYDAQNDGVIEASAQGVHRSSLDDFMKKSVRILIIRPIWATDETAPKAVDWAISMIGKRYNFTGLIGLDAPDSYYCTQLAIEAYRPFMSRTPDNPIPTIIKPGQMYHWGRIVYDSGPTDMNRRDPEPATPSRKPPDRN